MAFTLTIKTDNAAFFNDEEPAKGFEVARILRRLADRIDDENSGEGQVNDLNGNNVGNWKLT